MRNWVQPVPEPHPVRYNRWVWAAEIDWLPDTTNDDKADSHIDRDYLHLAEIVASSEISEAFVQFRMLSPGRESGGATQVWLIGGAATKESSLEAWELVAATLPEELPVSPAPAAVTSRVLSWFDQAKTGTSSQCSDVSIIEVRRAVSDGLPWVYTSVRDELNVPVVSEWRPEQDPLRAALRLMSTSAARSALVLHMEPHKPSVELLAHLYEIFTVVSREDSAGKEYRSYLSRLADQYSRRLQMIPHLALHVRVCLFASGRRAPGIAESIAVSLTDSGGFELDSFQSETEYEDGIALYSRAESIPWSRHQDAAVDELLSVVLPAEAAKFVRLPSASRGGIPGVRTAPALALSKSPQVPAGSRLSNRSADSPYIVVGHSRGGSSVTLTDREINQHVLVAGLPGFGKTHTVQTILRNLWRDRGVPFLVLDPAKADYGALIAEIGGRAQHIVLGPDAMAFNPFCVPEGVPIHGHAARVVAAFDAALKLSVRWPFGLITLSRGLFRAYETCGEGKFPTLRDLYATVGDVIQTSGMDSASMGDQRAGLLGRLESMVRGPLGAALTGGPQSGIDWNDLLSRPTVIEFRGFTGPTERSLVFALLIAGIASYREAHLVPGGLRHVTVLEEAHRVLAGGGEADNEGVRLLAEAIAELRGSGEGFVVVDQAPTALHPVVRKVTGSVIAHRIVESNEREAIGASLLLGARQSEDLARLLPGEAIVYGAERTASTLARILNHSAPTLPVNSYTSIARIDAVEPLFCVGCPTMCRFQTHGKLLAVETKKAGKSIIAGLDDQVMIKQLGGVSWCAAAHELGADARAADPAWLLSQLQIHLGRYKRTRRAVANSG